MVVCDQKRWPGPKFDSIDLAALARFQGAKAERLTWSEFGHYIEFWSAVYCLRGILDIRIEGRATEAELWRSAYKIGRMYANMQTARAWASGGMSSKKGRPKGISRATVTDTEIETAMRIAKGSVRSAAKQVGMDPGSLRRRQRKKRTANP